MLAGDVIAHTNNPFTQYKIERIISQHLGKVEAIVKPLDGSPSRKVHFHQAEYRIVTK